MTLAWTGGGGPSERKSRLAAGVSSLVNHRSRQEMGAQGMGHWTLASSLRRGQL